VTEGDDDPAFDDAISHALLRRVGGGDLAPTIRLFRPRAALQFGKLDRRRPGFDAACDAARRHGFTPVLRVVGGLAAAHDERSLVFDEFTHADLGSIHERFERTAGRLLAALRAVGVDARIGPIAGEYCPGDYSISSAGTLKVVGIAQRVVKGAALVSTVIVVGGGERIRSVLVDVYRELEIDWSPTTAGALQDHVPGLTVADVERAILEEYGDVVPWEPDDETLALARELVAGHRV
jgi:lipoate-protein ligase A